MKIICFHGISISENLKLAQLSLYAAHSMKIKHIVWYTVDSNKGNCDIYFVDMTCKIFVFLPNHKGWGYFINTVKYPEVMIWTITW